MTLIFSIQGEGIGYLGVSDVLTSRPENPDGEEVFLPLREGRYRHSNAGHLVSGARQKALIRNRTLILWAGDVAVARTAIQLILDNTDHGKTIGDIPNILKTSGLKDEELARISLIYHFIDTESGKIRRYRYHCEGYEIASYHLAAAGSGHWDFVENTIVQFDGVPVNARTITDSIALRVGHHLLLECQGPSNHDYLYGGWFEISSDGGGSFRRMPLAMKFWKLDERGNVEKHHNVVFSYYSADFLHVARLHKKAGRSKIDVHVIGDIFNAEYPEIEKCIERIVWQPELIFHIVSDHDQKNFVIMARDGETGGYQLNFDANKRNAEQDISEELLEEIRGSFGLADGDFSVRRVSDPK